MKNRYVLGLFCVITSAVIYGLSPTGILMVYEGGGNAFSVCFLRMLLNLPVTFLLMIRYPKKDWKINRKQLGDMILLSLGMGITNLLLVWSYEQVGTGMATALHFTYPMFTLIFCVVLYKEPLQWRALLCMLLSVGGVVFCCNLSGGASTVGTITALLSGLVFGLYMTYLPRCSVSSLPSITTIFYVHLIMSIYLGVLTAATGHMQLNLTMVAWLMMIFLSIVLTLGGSLLLQVGILRIGPQRAAIFCTFEPLTAVLTGALFLHESMSIRNYIGAALILSSIILLTVTDHRKREKVRQLTE